VARLVSVVMTRTQAEQLLWYIERGTEEGTMLIRLTPTDTTCSIQIVGSETRFKQEIK